MPRIIVKPSREANNPFKLEAFFRDNGIPARMEIDFSGDYFCVFNKDAGGYVVLAQDGAEDQALAAARSIGFEPIIPLAS